MESPDPEPVRSLEEELQQRIADRATGTLEVRDGRKRWRFGFVDGELVSTRSNLKSEQPDAVRARMDEPDPSPSAVTRVQAICSLRHALRVSNPTLTWRDDLPASGEPLDLDDVMVEALAQARDEDALRQLATSLLDLYPEVVTGIPKLGNPALQAYLETLDGARTAADLVAFAPVPARQVLAALWWGTARGWLVGSAAPAAAPTIRPAAPDPSSEPPISASGDDLDIDASLDIDAWIAEAVDADRPTDPDPDAPFRLAAGPSDPAGSTDRPSSGRPAHASVEGPASNRETAARATRLRALADRIRQADNHFQVLDVPWDAPPDQFRAAYFKLASELHPDRLTGASAEIRELASELFERVRVAWEDLGDDQRRAVYIDRVIHGRKTEQELAMDQVRRYYEAEADFKRGLAAFHAGQIHRSHEMFAAAVDKIPDELEFKAYLGYTTFSVNRARDPEAAARGLEMLQEVITANEHQKRRLDSAWMLMGRAWREQGDPKKARRYLVEALRLNPANADAAREMRRLDGQSHRRREKSGFLAGLFGKRKTGKKG